MNQTRIEKGMWWDRAWSLVEGCTPISAGCEHCWSAAATAMRAKQSNPKIHARYEGLTSNGVFNGKIRLMRESLELPLHVKKPTTWAIWNDLFHDDVPFEFIDNVFAVAALCPQHTFQILTKRPERMLEYFSETQPGDMAEHLAWVSKSKIGRLVPIHQRGQSQQNLRGHQNPNGTFGTHFLWPLPNVWLGVTAENQATADERIPLLLQCPAAVRFISAEPLLSPIDFAKWIGYNPVYENKTIRTGSLDGDSTGRTRDRFTRQDLANSKTGVGQVEKESCNQDMQACPSGTQNAIGIPANADYGQQETNMRGGASNCVSGSCRRNTERDDHQPQERDQKRQPTVQSGNNDIFGTNATCQQDIGDRSGGESMGRVESSAQVDGGTGREYPQGNAENHYGNETSAQPRHPQPGESIRSGLCNGVERGPQIPLAISQIIVGGETGPGARPMDPNWARKVRDDCQAAGVAFFLKHINKQDGRLLDEMEWSEMPEQTR